MAQSFYLQPTALIHGPDAEQAIADGVAGSLAGGPIAFTQIRMLKRPAGGRREDLRSYADIKASGDAAVAEALAALERARPGLPGLKRRETAVMGVVNVTPDSFSDGGEFGETDAAIAQGRALIAAGADVIDIGGESTRPGSDPVSESLELDRVLPVIEALMGGGVPVSIDTRKPEVMRRAVAAGACVINDISALSFDRDAVATARDLGVPVILMHSRGDPKTMQEDPRYDDVVLDVYDALAGRVDACVADGIARERIIVDPGIGFGKTFAHNHALLRGLTVFHGLGLPVLLGASRKAFIGALSDAPVAGQRLGGSLAAALTGIMQGVQMVRVHDVRETVHAARTWHGIWPAAAGT